MIALGLGRTVPLTVVESPYREITRPILEHVKDLRRESPRDLVAVYIPEYVVGRWWERLLHNRSTMRLRGRLVLVPSVMVISVPWQLDSSARLVHRPPARIARASVRRPARRITTEAEARNR